MGEQPLHRVWMTLHEPRSITATMVTVYLVEVVAACFILFVPFEYPTEIYVSSIIMLVGGIVGVPSTWRGAHWSEWFAAAFSALGIGSMTAFEITYALYSDYIPARTVFLLLATIALFLTRAIRIKHEMYIGTSAPMTPRKKAILDVKVQKDLLAAATEEANSNRDKA